MYSAQQIFAILIVHAWYVPDTLYSKCYKCYQSLNNCTSCTYSQNKYLPDKAVDPQ